MIRPVQISAVSRDRQQLLQVYVFDRELLNNGVPLYQSITPGGLSASQTFFLRCLAAM